MKNTMKKLSSLFLCVLLLAACLAGLGITASAEDNVLEISGLGDWHEFMMEGGRARLTCDLSADPLDTLYSNQDMVYILDLCGHSLSCRHTARISYNSVFVCFSSEENGVIFANEGFENNGKFALMNATFTGKSADRFGPQCMNRGTMILYDAEIDVGYPDGLINDGAIMHLELDGGEITSDEFPEFVCAPFGFAPTRPGYNFRGWTYDGGKQVIDFSALSGDVTVSPNWTAAYTVTFDALGGVCDTETLQPGNSLTLSSLPSATKDGVCFGGWCMPDGSPVTEDTVFNEDTTVTACWVPETEKADELAAAMTALGFSQSRIDDFTAQLSASTDGSSAASVFLPPNVWVCVGLAVIIAAAAVLAVVLVRRRNSGKM